jgi:hypothetical protein
MSKVGGNVMDAETVTNQLRVIKHKQKESQSWREIENEARRNAQLLEDEIIRIIENIIASTTDDAIKNALRDEFFYKDVIVNGARINWDKI